MTGVSIGIAAFALFWLCLGLLVADIVGLVFGQPRWRR